MSNSNSWFPFSSFTCEAKVRLFCFPYAGGGASIYRNWANEMPPFIEVIPVQIPGRENSFIEKPFTQVTPLIDQLLGIIIPYLDKPFAFLGHSMGAIIAFEMTRSLLSHFHQHPVCLFVSARRAPYLSSSATPIYNLPSAELKQELTLLNGVQDSILSNTELLELMLPVIRADLELSNTYIAAKTPLLDCPITAFGGQEDTTVSQQDLEAWQEVTKAEFRLQMLPGKHLFINDSRTLLIESVAQDLMYYSRESK